MNRRRILVTGASGFTGRYVVSALKNAGFEPYALKANLCDATSLEAEVVGLKPFAAIHLAGIAYVGHGNPADFYRVNLIGTLSLLQALAASGSVTGPVVLSSSANIYGNAYQNEEIQESFLPQPVNDYAVSKLAMEKMAALWFPRLSITVVRPFNYTGVGQSENFVVPKIVTAFRERQPELILGNIRVWRNFSDVRDVARWYVEIIKKNIIGGTFNFCSKQVVSIEEIVLLCQELSGHEVKIRSASSLKRKNELVRLAGDCTLIENALGDAWAPKFNMRQTLSWMLMNK